MTQSANLSSAAHRGSYVMITGAAGGLGKAFAVECASRGWDLVLTDLQIGPLNTLADSLSTTYGIQAAVYPCDLSDPGSRAGLLDWIENNQAALLGPVQRGGS